VIFHFGVPTPTENPSSNSRKDVFRTPLSLANEQAGDTEFLHTELQEHRIGATPGSDP